MTSAPAHPPVHDSKLEPLILRIEDAAKLMSVSPRTVWRLIGTGDLAVVRVLRSVRVPRASVDAFVRRGGSKS